MIVVLVVFAIVCALIGLALSGESQEPQVVGAPAPISAEAEAEQPWYGYGPGEEWTEEDQYNLLRSLAIANGNQPAPPKEPFVPWGAPPYSGYSNHGRGNPYGDVPGQKPSNPPPDGPPDGRPGYHGPVKPMPGDDGIWIDDLERKINEKFNRVYVEVKPNEKK